MQDTKMKEFLSKFNLSDSQLQEVYKRFNNEVSRGLARATHSKSDIKCYITYVQELPNGTETGKFLALDLGGTNFRVLLVTLKGRQKATFASNTYAVPKDIMTGESTQLFDHIASCLAEFVREHNLENEKLPLGFTFSFPCVQLGLGKAELTRWTKGFSVSGVVQKDVVALLNEAIARRNDIDISVIAILNDTTGTLMSCALSNQDCRIGVIIGTGCNACYVENVKNAELLEDEFKKDKNKIVINTEWGAFGDSGLLDFIRTEYDREIDVKSINVGGQIFEKMISGMYLGELVRLILIKAINANLIFVSYTNKKAMLDALDNNHDCFETRHISEIEEDNFPEFKNTKIILKELFGLQKPALEDCMKLRYICESVAKRAATLVGIGLGALINRINEPRVVVAVDGSVYRFHPKFDEYMRETISKLINPAISFDLMLSEDGSGRGAALVAAVASLNN